MAIVKFSSVISDVRGSVGRLTFQKFAGGTSIRNKPSQRKNASSSQRNSRVLVTRVQLAWAALTVSQQAEWSAFVAFSAEFQRRNNKVLLSGYQLFLKYNLIRLHAGQVILNTVSYDPLDRVVPTPILRVDVGDLGIDFSENFPATTSYLLIKITPVLQQYNNSSFNRLRVMPVEYISVPGDVWGIGEGYIDTFGALPAIGDRVLLQMQNFSLTSPIMDAPVNYFLTVDTF
jgi:hypothetical protein